MKQKVSEKAISQMQTVEEKSKKRAEELRASLKPAGKSNPASKGSPKPQLSEQDLKAIENAIVEELNLSLAIVHTSTTNILIEKSESEFVLDSKASLLILYENQVVPELAQEKSKKPTKATVWLKSPNRRTFRNIVCNPKIAGHYDGNFNIWKGFAITAIRGDCSLFWHHVEAIICGGKKADYIYVRKWLAHLIQNPWVVTPALVLRGKQGTGKGTFVHAIGKLFGSHYAPLASLNRIVGRFNSHLKNKLLIFADEAIWRGDKRELGALKSLITEPRIFIEAKGQDGYWIDNFKHLIISSNEDCPVHLDPDDRRFFVLDLPNDRKEDHVYFEKLNNQLENGGYEALMHDLLYEDLTGFNPQVMPENFAGFDMKLERAPSIDKFIHTSLKEGCWDHAHAMSSETLKNLTIDQFYSHYKTWCEYEKQPLLRKEQVGKGLRKIIPGVATTRTSRGTNALRPTTYIFPALEECRSSFEKFYKQNSAIWDWS